MNLFSKTLFLKSLSFSLILCMQVFAAVLNVDQNDGGCSDIVGMPYCTIGPAVLAAVPLDTVSVAPGNYVENVNINKNLMLISTMGRTLTTIQGISMVGALGTIQLQSMTAGSINGFTILGIDNGNPAVENAAVYVRGNNSNVEIRNNEIVAQGEAGLLSEFGATVTGFVIDGNIFSGKTFIGAVAADCGFANQFITPNVPRQLVTMGGGGGGGSTSNITFTNNTVNGVAGGGMGGACIAPIEQGNTLVTIDSNGATITGNIFSGTTSRFATSLRSRGPNTMISANQFLSEDLGPNACHAFIQEIGSNLGDVAGANNFDTTLVFAPDNPLATTGNICLGERLVNNANDGDDDDGSGGGSSKNNRCIFDSNLGIGNPDCNSFSLQPTRSIGATILPAEDSDKKSSTSNENSIKQDSFASQSAESAPNSNSGLDHGREAQKPNSILGCSQKSGNESAWLDFYLMIFIAFVFIRRTQKKLKC